MLSPYLIFATGVTTVGFFIGFIFKVAQFDSALTKLLFSFVITLALYVPPFIGVLIDDPEHAEPS